MTPVEQITALYIGYFGRAPEPAGLNYWVGRLNDGFSLAEIAQSFSVQPEATNKYPYLANPEIASPQAFITQIYMNLFNRVPDAAGLAYWTEQLENGADVGSFILDVTSGAQGDDLTIVENKVEVGVDFALSAADQPGFIYNEDAATAAFNVIDGVDATDASVAEGKAETDAFINGGVTGDTFTLTTALGEQVVGTAGNDTFNVITDGANATLNTFDTISGRGGIDTALLVSAGSAVLPTSAQINGVENIVLDAGALTATLDASVLADVESVEFINFGVTDLTLGDGQSVILANTTAAVTTINVDAAEVSTTITLDDVASGQDITLVGAANTTLNIEGSVAGVGALTVTAAATTETLNIDLSSDSALTITGAAVTAIDASASTGDLTFTGTATTEAILGGSGDDAITGGAASQLINAGAGDDTITAGNVAGEVIIGGAGQDDVTLGGAGSAQTVSFTAGTTGLTAATIDTVTGFATTEDFLDFNLEAGTATNFLADNSAGGYLDALVNANAAFANDSALTYVASTIGTDTIVFVDYNNDGSADAAVQLTGNAGIAFGDIVA